MEAALRTAVAVTAPAGAQTMPKLDFTEVRGLQGEAQTEEALLESLEALGLGGQMLVSGR